MSVNHAYAGVIQIDWMSRAGEQVAAVGKDSRAARILPLSAALAGNAALVGKIICATMGLLWFSRD
jgi:hypothetical protein